MTSATPTSTAPSRFIGSPVELRRRLERWGPTFVKIGQYLALRPDLVRDEYADELMRLLDRAEPFPWAEAQRTLDEAFGPRWMDRFLTIDPVPVAAGSLAQVHRARLRDDTVVAVKIRRPGVEHRVERDLRRGRLLARILEWSGAAFVASPREVIDEVGDWLRAELDFTREGANLARMRQFARGSRAERVPQPYRELTTTRVLTAEYLEGEPISAILEALRVTPFLERERLRAGGIDLDLVTERLLHATLRQIFEYRFFHADPHPGNLRIVADNRIGYVDFGLCDTLDETVAASQMSYLAALYRQDAAELLRGVEEILVPGEGTDMAAFRRDFLDQTDRWIASRDEARAGWSADAFNRSPTATYMVSVMRAIRRHRLHVPARALAMYRALLTAEIVAGRLAPGIDLAVVGSAFFRKHQTQEVLRALEPERLQANVPQLVELLREGPSRANQVLSDLANGQFSLNVHVVDEASTRRGRTRYVRLLVTVLLSISVALLLSRPSLPQVFGVPLSETLFVVLLILYVSVFVQWRRLPW